MVLLYPSRTPTHGYASVWLIGPLAQLVSEQHCSKTSTSLYAHNSLGIDSSCYVAKPIPGPMATAATECMTTVGKSDVRD